MATSQERGQPEGLRSYHATVAGLHATVVGAIHGDEPCGLYAINRIAAELERGELSLRAGRLTLLHGNPEATRHGRRFSEGGTDLNRLFDFAFEESLARKDWCYEHTRAFELRPLIESWDAVLDLHSATRPTAPFAIWPWGQPQLDLVRNLGVSLLTVGWEHLGLPGSKALISVLARHGHPALAIECGAHTSRRAGERAYRYARSFLDHLGVIDFAREHNAEFQILDIEGSMQKPTAEYRFPMELAGMTLITEGTDLGFDEPIPSDFVAVMPNDNASVPVGGDLLYIGKLRKPFSP